MHRIGSETDKALLHPANPGCVGRDLGPQVALALAWGARVEQHEREHVRAQLALVEQLDGRDPQPFLKDAGAVRALAARHLAADVGMVGDVGDERDGPAVEEDRARQRQIGQVRAAAHVRVVREEAVAGTESVQGVAPGDVLDEAEQ